MILYVASATASSYGHSLALNDLFILKVSNTSSIMLFLNSFSRFVLYQIQYKSDREAQFTSKRYKELTEDMISSYSKKQSMR